MLNHIEAQRLRIRELEKTVYKQKEELDRCANTMKNAYNLIEEYEQRFKHMVEAKKAVEELGNMTFRGLLHIIVLFIRRKYAR